MNLPKNYKGIDDLHSEYLRSTDSDLMVGVRIHVSPTHNWIRVSANVYNLDGSTPPPVVMGQLPAWFIAPQYFAKSAMGYREARASFMVMVESVNELFNLKLI